VATPSMAVTVGTSWSGSPGLDASPEVVEGDAVVERGAVNDPAAGELHDPGVAVLRGLAVAGDPAAVPDNDDGVVVGVDRADRDWAGMALTP
jgi:hypothetical protein